ncbi:MAG: glycoside hydrolase family 3 protein, partial [Firmicutes bacterium]|nr:glycoside hydrolase family 3 protein [Bacillota bacterium]
TVFPGNMALGAAGSEDLARQSAKIMARELRIMGINFNFAPVVDVNSNPANPVIGVRSFGSRPQEVARLGRAMLAPYLQEKVIATAKHFPGHGDTDVDSHYGLPLIPYSLPRLEEVELAPFQAMIDAGVPAVMMAHILAPGLTGSDVLPASLSPKAIRYLREEMGFQGLVVTDSLGMGAISDNWGLEEASVMAFQAGADVILLGPWAGVEPGDGRRIFDALKNAVDEGTITRERLDESVKRILAAKVLYGIIDDPLPQREKLPRLALPESRDLARRIARESITLVRDNVPLLPLSTDKPVSLIWPAEVEGSLAPLTEGCPFLQPHLLSLRAGEAEMRGLLDLLHDSSPLLVGTYNLQHHPAWVELINTLARERDVMLLALASPYDILAAPAAGACLCTYSDSGVSMQALAEVLNGTLVPRGRLPVELPGIE